MHATLESIKSAAPPVGATLVGWPWWAVAIVLVASCGSSWVMGWLDVVDRVRSHSTAEAALESPTAAAVDEVTEGLRRDGPTP
jgi:hypothetical protein